VADNVVLDPGVGGATAATDDIGGVHYQRVKVTWGTDGTANDANASTPLPVTVTSSTALTPGTAAANLGKAEDAAHATGDTGVLMLGVRRDTPASGAGTDGDYATLNFNANGYAYTLDQNSAAALASLQAIETAVEGTLVVASHAVTNAGTFAVQAAQSGTWNVTVNAAIAAGNNNIGDVDVASIVPGTGATNLGKAEDAVHSSGDVGVMVLGVRQDSQVDLAADGDYAPFTIDDSGGVRVSIVAGAGSGGTAAADDADFTAGTTQGTPAMGVYESTPTSVTDGDLGTVGITVNRELKVAVSSGGVEGILEDSASAGGEEGIAILAVRRDAASSGVGADGDFAFFSVDSNGALRVTGGGGGTQFAEDAAHTTADVGTVMLAVRRDTAAVGSDTDGDYSTVNVNSAGRVYTTTTVDAALPAGTNNIGDVDVLTLPGAAHDAAVSGNPVRVAGRGMSADYTAVATGDTADLLATLLGKLVTQPYALPANTWSSAAGSGGITNTTAVTVKAAGAAGVRNYVTGIDVVNTHATVDTEFMIRDGAAGAVLWRTSLKALGGGVSRTFDPPLRGTAATLVEIVNVTTGAAVYANLTGYSAAE
jgi:hypothetical protein